MARIALDHDLAFGIGEGSGRLSAFIHLAVHDEIGELAASVLPEYRRQGQARQLFATGHPAALHIGRGLGYMVETRPTSPRATISLSSAGQ